MSPDIAWYPVFGKPLILYLGALTLLAVLLTAAITVLNKKGVRVIPFRWHPVCAGIAIVLAAIHATLGILAYL